MATRPDPGDLRRLTNSRSAKPKAAHHTARKPVVILRHARKAGAGEGNRTLVVSLEGFCSTIELHPPSFPVHQNWWRGLDSNQRRQSQQIYSLPPLTTRAPLRTEPYILIVYFYLVNQYLK